MRSAGLLYSEPIFRSASFPLVVLGSQHGEMASQPHRAAAVGVYGISGSSDTYYGLGTGTNKQASLNAARSRRRMARLISSNGFGVGVNCLVPSGVCSFGRVVRDCPRPLATWGFPLAWLRGLSLQAGQVANA